MPDCQQRPKATDAERGGSCVSYLEADSSRCISSGSRTGTRVLQHWDSSGAEQTQPPGKHWIHGYVHKDLPSERANVSVPQTGHSLFQDLTDTQASAFGVTHMPLTSWPQDAASCFWWEESIKLSLGGSYVPHSASKSNADRKILLQGNQRLPLACREHIRPSSHTVKIYSNLVATVVLKVQAVLNHGKGQTGPASQIHLCFLGLAYGRKGAIICKCRK